MRTVAGLAGRRRGPLMYHMHRIYCATPWELEEERGTFYAAVGEFNATHAMPRGVLYVWSPHMPLSVDGGHINMQCKTTSAHAGITFRCLMRCH